MPGSDNPVVWSGSDNPVSDLYGSDNPVDLCNRIRNSGCYNFEGCRIPLNTHLNIPLWRRLLIDYDDVHICDYLEFGWPINYTRDTPPVSTLKNHGSANSYPESLKEYIETELYFKALAGPFHSDPFQGELTLSALQTVEKKESAAGQRRVVLDLSFPRDRSVNAGIPKEQYVGDDFELHFPTIDNFCELIQRHGRHSLMFKRDLSRAYRQLLIDPHDYNLLGFQWDHSIYFDRSLPFGLRSAAMACQRTTSAVKYIFHKQGRSVENYLDDFGGVDSPEKAQASFQALGNLLSQLGLVEANSKVLPPSTKMVFVGVLCNSDNMTISVTPERLTRVNEELARWKGRKTATKREIQSLVGKLNFLAKCVKPGRLFMSRLLHTLSKLEHSSHHTRLSAEFQQDISWWYHFVREFNGVSVIKGPTWTPADAIFATDSSLAGCGGQSGQEFFSYTFPPSIRERHINIAGLEFLAIVIGAKLWAQRCSCQRVAVACDNEAVVNVVNSGRSRDQFLQACARELLFVAAQHDFEIKAVHIPGKSNFLPDLLSRFPLDKTYRLKFEEATGGAYHMLSVTDNLAQFSHNW